MQQGCRTAGIGCLECKQPVIDSDRWPSSKPIRERAQRFLDDPTLVRKVSSPTAARKRSKLAEETMRDVREAMGLKQT